MNDRSTMNEDEIAENGHKLVKWFRDNKISANDGVAVMVETLAMVLAVKANGEKEQLLELAELTQLLLKAKIWRHYLQWQAIKEEVITGIKPNKQTIL
jgi:hypothetical protein